LSGEQGGYPPLSKIASELAEIEECTEAILGSAGAIASIFAGDEDEALSILGRARYALEVVTFYLMREESDAKDPGAKIPAAAMTFLREQQ
jgi:hypothetical protein